VDGGHVEWTLRFTCDRHGQPEFGWLAVEYEGHGAMWVADADFGPFDTLTDVVAWAVRKATDNRPRPSEVT